MLALVTVLGAPLLGSNTLAQEVRVSDLLIFGEVTGCLQDLIVDADFGLC